MNFYTTDTHYGHINICKGATQWDTPEECRDFQTVADMNTTIINGINSVVGSEDTLYHLGDWSFDGIQNIWNFRKQINCKNIHLVLGNHDDHIAQNKQIQVHHSDFELFQYLTNGEGLYYTDKGKDYVRVETQGLFKSVKYYDVIKFKGLKVPVSLFHYAQRVWLKSHKGGIQLHGHSHGSLQPYKNREGQLYRTMDLYRDNFKPYSEEELVDIMKDRPSLIEVDHHTGRRD